MPDISIEDTSGAAVTSITVSKPRKLSLNTLLAHRFKPASLVICYLRRAANIISCAGAARHVQRLVFCCGCWSAGRHVVSSRRDWRVSWVVPALFAS